jgi:hypothetical protein
MIILHSVVSKIGDWTIDVHSRHGPEAHQHKHVHITRRGLGGEYSWNIDGTRHDEHRFPSSEPAIKKAKKIAAGALGISVNSLIFVADFPHGCSTIVRVKMSGSGRTEVSRHHHDSLTEGALHILRTEQHVIFVWDDPDEDSEDVDN